MLTVPNLKRREIADGVLDEERSLMVSTAVWRLPFIQRVNFEVGKLLNLAIARGASTASVYIYMRIIICASRAVPRPHVVCSK